jgi:hypothetical protein
MSAEINSIKVAYEQENLTPEEIASDRELDVAAVKAALMQSSSKYRKACGHEDESESKFGFDSDQEQRVMEVIVDLALSAENEKVRLDAATYVRDDRRGRKDVAKHLGGSNFNILFLNEQLKKVRSVSDRITQSVLGDSSRKEIIDAG